MWAVQVQARIWCVAASATLAMLHIMLMLPTLDTYITTQAPPPAADCTGDQCSAPHDALTSAGDTIDTEAHEQAEREYVEKFGAHDDADGNESDVDAESDDDDDGVRM